MILILTGGIGSGKSLAAGMLNEMYGFPVYSADRRVKDLYAERPELLERIEKETGCAVRDENGLFVPSLLSRKIFSDDTALNKVECLVFPVLMEDFKEWMEEHPAPVHILESATILEKEFFRGFGDFALVINAPSDVRIKRAVERDSVTPEQVKARLDKQSVMNDLSRLDVACWLPFEVCENAGTSDDLRANLTDFVEKYGLTKML